MPGEPRADQSPSAVGGHHQAVKKIRFRMQESKGVLGCGSQNWGEGILGRLISAPLTLLRSAGYPQLSSAPSWTERNSARRTRASSREISAGRPSDPSPGLSSDSEQPARPGGWGGGMLSHVLEARLPDGTCRVSLPMRSRTPLPLSDGGGFPHRPGDAAFRTHDSTYRPGRSARSTVLQGAGGDGGDPPACSGHSREGAGEAPEETPGGLPPGTGPQGSLLAS